MRVMQTFGEPRDTTNPYLVMLRDALVAEPTIEHVPFSWRGALTGRYDVLHVHWPDTLLAARHWWTKAGKRAALAALDVRLRRRRIAVVRTVHNVTAPSGPYLDRALVRSLDRRTDVRIRISALTPEVDGVPSVLIPHGHYRDWFDGMPRAAAVRGRLGYVGLIKPYKGVERLVDAFAAASALDPALTLRIAGKPTDETVERRLRAASERLSGLETTLEYVGEAAFVEVVTSSELVVLPYRFMHNSGAALAALSLERPVLVPDNDLTRALSSEVGSGWMHLFAGELTADALLDAVRAVRTAPPEAPPDLGAREWDDVGPRHAHAYRLAMGQRRDRATASTTAVPAQEGDTRGLVIAIPTFRRPDALATALSAVRQQVDAANHAPDPPMRCSILVVDNDPAGSGEPIAAKHAVQYVLEPRPGIAAVRNRAIAECDGARALLFIDDDEVPEAGWLRAMVGMYRSTGPTAVAGRVVTRFPADVEPWVDASGAFVRPTRVHGQTMREAATNNLLLDLDGVRRLGLSFDERFGLTGGSDSMFTLQLTRRGGSIRWAEDAVVIEQEDPKRFVRSWVLMRTFRYGNASARVRIALAPPGFRRLVARLLALGRGGARVLGGGARWGFGALSGSLPHRARGLRTASRGLGMMTAAIGYAHDEYRRRRSSSA
jgi:glycosyltransferase involved in cell wall biosynthesis